MKTTLRIHAPGPHPHLFTVTTPEGEQLRGVTSIEIGPISAEGGPTEARITFLGVEVDIEALCELHTKTIAKLPDDRGVPAHVRRVGT